MKKHGAILLFFMLHSITLSADTEAEMMPSGELTKDAAPYLETEFPQWTRDLRRSEIIALGSLPFVTLGTTLVYSLCRYCGHGFSSDYIPNLFVKSSDSSALSTDEQKKILVCSCAASLGLGAIDFAFTLAGRHRISKKDNKMPDDTISITPDDSEVDSTIEDSNDEYIYGGMKSALF